MYVVGCRLRAICLSLVDGFQTLNQALEQHNTWGCYAWLQTYNVNFMLLSNVKFIQCQNAIRFTMHIYKDKDMLFPWEL